MPGYTHTFEIKWDEKGIEGEIEFNTDGKMTYKTNEALEDMTTSQVALLNDLFNVFHDIYKQYGDIEKIELTKK